MFEANRILHPMSTGCPYGIRTHSLPAPVTILRSSIRNVSTI